MKFHVVILCICIVQICSGADSVVDNQTGYQMKQQFRDELNAIHGASKQFIDDVTFVLEKMENNTLIESALSVGLLKILSSKGNGTIRLKDVRDFQSRLYEGRAMPEDLAEHIDYMKVLQSVFARQTLSSERFIGILNLCYIFFYPKAEPKEIESALHYLYGNETNQLNVAFIDSLVADPVAEDCPVKYHRYSDAIDKLRSMADIRPTVIADAKAILEKFPCNEAVLEIFEHFVYLIERFQGDQPKISVCYMQKQLQILENDSEMKYRKRAIDINLERMEYILPIRLTDETFSGMMNFIKASKVGTSIGEIQKAVEYLYENMLAEICPTISLDSFIS